MKKFIALLLVVALTASISIAGTMAYLQDEDSDVNVMTVGNVYIEQIEQERDANGDLVPFKQAKPAYPAVGTIAWDDTKLVMNKTEYKVFDSNLKNVVDKIVTVKNTGVSKAFVRTVIAIEAPGFDPNDLIHINYNDIGVEISNAVPATINGNEYVIFTFTYAEALNPGATSAPSLIQVFLDSKAENEDCEAFGDTWDILTLSQAVQTEGFADAKTALDTAFGKSSEKAAEWFGTLGIPEVTTHEDVIYIVGGEEGSANSNGGTIVYRGIFSDGENANVKNVTIGEGIDKLNNRALCKSPNLTSVELPSSLTYIDEGVFQESGFKSLEIPENVTYIGKQAMGACGSLEKIVINAKNVTIATYVARACPNLKEVYINSDSVTFETGSMYFTNKENADASGITFYVNNQGIADTLYSAFSTSHSYGLLIKNVDGTVYYNTLK